MAGDTEKSNPHQSLRPQFPSLLPPLFSHPLIHRPRLLPLDQQLPLQPHLLILKEIHGFLHTFSSALERCRLSFLSAFHRFSQELLLSSPRSPQKWMMDLPNVRSHSRNALASYNFAAVLPGDSVAAVVVSTGVLNFLNIYNTLLVVRLILTWFPSSPQVIVNPLSTICDPYLNIFRGIIPPLGGTIDLSPILAFLVLNAFTNSAAALPAELPATAAEGKHQLYTPSLTWNQEAWLKRQKAAAAKKS